MNYYLHILILCEIYMILALAMDLLAGYSGMLSLAQAAFYGAGAYAMSLLMTRAGLGFFTALPLTVAICLVLSLPVIWFSIVLRDLFFILATMAWQVLFFTILYNWTGLTNASFGIPGIPRPALGSFVLSSTGSFAILGGIITLLVLLFFTGLYRTPLVRYFRAVKDDQLVLITYGKRPGHFKMLAILLSAGVSAIAGALYATYSHYIDPTSFTLGESIFLLSIVLIGGSGSIRGSIAGALLYVLLPELLRSLHIPDAIAANLRMMIYSTILIVVVMFRPQGLFGKFQFE